MADTNKPQGKQTKGQSAPNKESKKTSAPQQPKAKSTENNAPKPNPKQTVSETKPAVNVAKQEETPKEVKPVQPQQASTNAPAQPPASADKTEKTEKPEKPQPKQIIKEKRRGKVKAVLSGDTMLVSTGGQQGVPAELEITISNITAPRMGRKKTKNDDGSADEEFAWQSREYLRKKVIGKLINYVIEYSPNERRSYATVALVQSIPATATEPAKEEELDLAENIVSNGWAKVRSASKEKGAPEVQKLITAEANSQKAGLGVFATGKDVLARAKRPLEVPVNHTELFLSLKGKTQKGVVERIKHGHSLKITLLPSLHEINVLLSGVECPEVPMDSKQVVPFAKEAKFLTEHYLLHREVDIHLDAVDKKTFYGSVILNGNNISEELLKNGLGHYVEWSGSRTSSNDKLKQAEKVAQEKKLRYWTTEVAPTPLSKEEQKKQIKIGREFSGNVIDIGNLNFTLLEANGNTRKLFLSSIRSARVTREKAEKADKEEKKEEKKEEAKPEAKEAKDGKKEKEEKVLTDEEARDKSLALEAREHLRKRMIGTKIRVVVDYTRKQKRDKGEEEELTCVTVYADKHNVAVELVEAGLVQVQEHKMGDPRSRDYEHLMIAENNAKSHKKGVFAKTKDAPIIRFSDLTSDDNHEKLKSTFESLKRAGKLRAVVEHEFAVHRYKVFVPKESCQIMFTLSGVRGPQRDQPFFKESLEWAKRNIHLHDVDIHVTYQDKNGMFFGTMTCNGENVAMSVLDEGLGEFNYSKDLEHADDYENAELTAKRKHKNIWASWNEEEERKKLEEEIKKEEEEKKPKILTYKAIVSEIIDGSRFYIQIINNEFAKLDELSKAINVDTPAVADWKPKVNDIVKAQFSFDNKWYRAQVQALNGEQAKVFYIDYGNSEDIAVSKLQALPAEISAVAGFAQLAKLAFVKVPGLHDDCGMEAAEFIRDYVDGKTLSASQEYITEGCLRVVLGEDLKSSLNAAILKEGLARMERGRRDKEKLEVLQAFEERGKQSRQYIWEYGNADSDDEKPRGGFGKKGANAGKKTLKPAEPAKAESKPAQKESKGKK